MRTLGIDPGYDRTGIAILEGNGSAPVYVYSACITTKRGSELAERLLALARALRTVIATYKPDACAIESLYFSSNQKTAMSVAAARGVAMLVAAEAKLPIMEYTPQAVKVAVTGYGKSDKGEVARMLVRLVPRAHKKALDDETDAIAVALTHLAHSRARERSYPQNRS